MNLNLSDKLTVLVNSCDAYDDLWEPFFKLYKKYWLLDSVRIILNTETKKFKYEGLNIECINTPKNGISYGKRMQNVLSQITTPYTVILLDDFFLDKPINTKQIKRIIDWMDKDTSIVYFNCDNIPVYADWDSDKYPGYHRIPRGNVYTLNLQAAIWRTDKLLKYWKHDVSPWEWEEYTNILSARNQNEKYYCVTEHGNGFCHYGYDFRGMGVHERKWIKEVVEPLFEKEGIKVDFSKRGFLEEKNKVSDICVLRDTIKTLPKRSDLIKRCLRKSDQVKYYFFAKKNKALGLFKYSPDQMYIRYMLLKERKKFIKKHPELLKKDEK